MFQQLTDRYAGVVVWRHLPPYAPSDFDEHLAMVRAVVDDKVFAARVLAVLVPGPGAASPPATHRKAIHAAMASAPPTACGMVIGVDRITQGVLTAVRWLGVIPAPMYAFADWGEASSSSSLPAELRAKVVVARELYSALQSSRSSG